MYRVGNVEWKSRWHWYSWKLKYDLQEWWWEYKESLMFGLLLGALVFTIEVSTGIIKFK